jgi:hypothetical protein
MAVPDGSFWKGAYFHPEVCVISTLCFEPRYQLWLCKMYNFIYYNHKHFVMLVQILHHVNCTDNMSCYSILLNVPSSKHMLSVQSILDTNTVSCNRSQQALASYLIVKVITVIWSRNCLLQHPTIIGIFVYVFKLGGLMDYDVLWFCR